MLRHVQFRTAVIVDERLLLSAGAIAGHVLKTWRYVRCLAVAFKEVVPVARVYRWSCMFQWTEILFYSDSTLT